jgi:anti-sigma factor RsiW
MNGDSDAALLVAFIDGELDESARRAIEARLAAEADLRAHLALLHDGARPFAQAFQALLDEAPVERLKAAAAALDARQSPPLPQRPKFRLDSLGIAAAIVLFCAGIATGRYATAMLAPPPAETTASVDGHQEDWRQAVAEYMALYTADTFNIAPEGQERGLATIGAKIGLELTPARVALADLPLKAAQILSFNGAPLGELAYVDPATGPLLFCIIKNAGPDGAKIVQKLEGFAVVSWARAGRGYMLIGRLPESKMAELADSLRRRF